MWASVTSPMPYADCRWMFDKLMLIMLCLTTARATSSPLSPNSLPAPSALLCSSSANKCECCLYTRRERVSFTLIDRCVATCHTHTQGYAHTNSDTYTHTYIHTHLHKYTLTDSDTTYVRLGLDFWGAVFPAFPSLCLPANGLTAHLDWYMHK